MRKRGGSGNKKYTFLAQDGVLVVILTGVRSDWTYEKSEPVWNFKILRT
jgi:hypothetical protein